MGASVTEKKTTLGTHSENFYVLEECQRGFKDLQTAESPQH